MASVQERLQLKRVPLDTWNIKEQLCLASAVVRSGDQNWMSVSRALKTVGEPNRPADWYSQKSCAAQYGVLLEHVETPKRKKSRSEGGAETPQESILKRLTQERINEIQNNVGEMNQQYEILKNEINELRNPSTSDDRLKEIWAEIEVQKKAKEKETAKQTAWLQEREEKRARVENAWRPAVNSSSSQPQPATPSSPLLTSLLKSSPVVTTPQTLSHPNNAIVTSPSAGAPTLSMLLEKCGNVAVGAAGAAGASGAAGAASGVSAPSPREKHAAIEHIKSQLVQIEQQLKANSVPAPQITPSLDIDDIEIKAEDVYAFRDVNIPIQPVNTDKSTVFKKCEPVLQEKPQHSIIQKDEIIDKSDVAEESLTEEEVTDVEMSTIEDKPEKPPTPPICPEPEVKLSFPEVKFPNTEIKVIQPEEPKIKEEPKELDAGEKEKKNKAEVLEVQSPIENFSFNQPTNQIERNQSPTPSQLPLIQTEKNRPTPAADADDGDKTDDKPSDRPIEDDQNKDDSIPGNEEPMDVDINEAQPSLEQISLNYESHTATSESSKEDETNAQIAVDKEAPVEQLALENEALDSDDRTEEKIEIKKEDEEEDSMPLKEILSEMAEAKRESRGEQDNAHADTDDDTPMELIREEEKDGKKKRDYSRKKKPDSRTCSGSESAAEASAPDSPSSSDAEKQHRLWKKSVMLVYSRLCAHKYASLFLRSISDEEAPGYSQVVKRPMDLSTIKRNIEAGHIRTTSEFQRDVLLMLSNALMYNSSEHSVHQMTKAMVQEAQTQFYMLSCAQAHANLQAEGVGSRRKRRARDSNLGLNG